MSADLSSLESTTASDISAFVATARQSAAALIATASLAVQKLLAQAAGDVVPALTEAEAAAIPFIASKAGPFATVISAFAAAATASSGPLNTAISSEVSTGLALADAEISHLASSLGADVDVTPPAVAVPEAKWFEFGRTDEPGASVAVDSAPTLVSIATSASPATVTSGFISVGTIVTTPTSVAPSGAAPEPTY